MRAGTASPVPPAGAARSVQVSPRPPQARTCRATGTSSGTTVPRRASRPRRDTSVGLQHRRRFAAPRRETRRASARRGDRPTESRSRSRRRSTRGHPWRDQSRSRAAADGSDRDSHRSSSSTIGAGFPPCQRLPSVHASANVHATMADARECPLCGGTMRLKHTEQTVHIPGNPKPTTRQISRMGVPGLRLLRRSRRRNEA